MKTPSVVVHRDESEIVPPSSVTVEATPKLVIYRADGTPLTRQIGFTLSSKERRNG